MNHIKISPIAVLLIFWLMVGGTTVAQSNPERKTLAGLRAIAVVVESIEPEIERAGLTASQLQTDVELRLRRSGISVLDTGGTYLYINANVLKIDNYSFAYSLKVSLMQPVVLERNKAISTIASTWDKGVVGVVGASNFQRIRQNAGDLVDAFINDYLAIAASAPSPQNQSPQTSRDTPRIDFSDVATPSNQSFQSSQDDVGIDIAYVTALKANLRELPNSPNIILQPEKDDVLALIDRTPRGTWYNVVHVRSGKEGWIDGSVIDIKYTKNPRPAPVFEERRVASNKDPELVVYNQTDRLLSLRLGDSLYSVPANSERSFTVPAGTYKFYASVPNAFPTLGEKYFPKGIIYSWRFYIVTRRR